MISFKGKVHLRGEKISALRLLEVLVAEQVSTLSIWDTGWGKSETRECVGVKMKLINLQPITETSYQAASHIFFLGVCMCANSPSS